MATPTPRQPIDISSLIRDAEDKRAQAKIEAQQAQRAELPQNPPGCCGRFHGLP